MYICIITSEIINSDYRKNRLKDELIELTSILLKIEENKVEYIEIYHQYIKPKKSMNIAGECWEEKGIRLEMIMNNGIHYDNFQSPKLDIEEDHCQLLCTGQFIYLRFA